MFFSKPKQNFFGKLSEKISEIITGRTVDEELLEELEETLILSDIGMDTTIEIVSQLREAVKKEKLDTEQQVKEKIVEIIGDMMDKGERQEITKSYPLIILVIGVNGGGKTTSIGKLAHKFKSEGKTVLLAAADTFRAAAAEQLQIWGERVGVNVVRHKEGADPSAVIFDAIQSAKAKDIDVLICDTAGRMQNKKNLMIELDKMDKIISKEYGYADRETLLVLDATTGKNAISQAKEFNNVADISGIILTKLDGTAKGGIAITISNEFDMPVKFIGIGEKMEDLKEFDYEEFAGGLLNG